MILQNILNEIENVDAEVYERLEHVSRRNMFQTFMKKAMKGAAAGAPVVFASMLNKAYAGQEDIVDVLNFALTLEYLEAEFYNVGLAQPNLLPAGSMARTIYTQIALHENEHVKLLIGALGGLKTAGGAAILKPDFDLTYKGAFANVLSDYNTYLAVSQALEDTGVRAYKGQAPRLIGTSTPAVPSVLEVALQIHSVEARHAARVRYLRGYKGWITNEDTSNIPGVGAVYKGDNMVTQAGINVSSITGISPDTISESFDEPLTKEQVLAIATPFIVKFN
ncbi:ferritin-like domain-containing protein [Spirosoma validum]|uniref:Ferritin-like domain-containing protein n=1 Tax=Spirosoma validum TaxID=2771355 RepID=A0A927GFN3_9BACT|nr:ferritin-like domain-containing protein [Spirosoma validum]MBD2756112.1 ferritin-like domain-containing protein [Spirosoma validum]